MIFPKNISLILINKKGSIPVMLTAHAAGFNIPIETCDFVPEDEAWGLDASVLRSSFDVAKKVIKFVAEEEGFRRYPISR